MTKHKDVEFSQTLFMNLQKMSASEQRPFADEAFASQLEEESRQPAGLRQMKKFRFQLLHAWLVAHFEPCRVADIGGGKGLLAYLLQKSGWETAVIDPIHQELPDKYKDFGTGRRVMVGAKEKVRHINKSFEPEMAHQFDLLIGMHAHGCNAKVIEATAVQGNGFILFPCCVIDEPFYPPIGTHWLESLTDYATQHHHIVHPFRLNFKGQNIGLCQLGQCQTKTL